MYSLNVFNLINSRSSKSTQASSLSSDGSDNSKSQRYVSYFNSRIFHELPRSFYLSDSADPQEDLAYINEFILNPKWLLNKSYTCSSVLYYLHDLISYRKLFMSAEESMSDDLANISPSSSSYSDASFPPLQPITTEELASLSTKKKFLRFERVIYKILFNLSQDQNQFGHLVRMLGIEPMLTNSASYFTTFSTRLMPANYEYFTLKEKLNDRCFEPDNREHVYFNKVVFVQRGGIYLTLSEAPHNLIKVSYSHHLTVFVHFSTLRKLIGNDFEIQNFLYN